MAQPDNYERTESTPANPADAPPCLPGWRLFTMIIFPAIVYVGVLLVGMSLLLHVRRSAWSKRGWTQRKTG